MMFRILTAYMVVFCCFVLVAKADPRINQDIGTCHFPYDAGDTDNEYKVTCKAFLKEASGRGAIAAYGSTHYTGVPYAMAPEEVSVNGNDSGVNCVMVNDDGAETQIQWWTSTVKKKCSVGPNQPVEWALCDVTYKLRCGRVAPVPE